MNRERQPLTARTYQALHRRLCYLQGSAPCAVKRTARGHLTGRQGNLMATVQHLKYTLIPSSTLLPGQTDDWSFAEDAFFKDKAVEVTVQPNEFANLNRTVEVTKRFRTTASAAPSQQLRFTVRNVGVDQVAVYYLLLGAIEA